MLRLLRLTVCPGVAHGAFNNDIEALLGIRELINYLPLSNLEHAPLRKCDDPWSVYKARFPLPELTGDQFPLPVNTGRVDVCAFPLAELTGRVDG